MFIKEILEATKGRLIKGDINASFRGISIDSRTIKKGKLFIALKGKNFDGHNFIKQAVEKGESGIVISKIPSSLIPHPSSLVIKVADTTKALGDIASYQRRKFNIPLIAVTGSNGKSTVKELIAFLLSSRRPTGKYQVLKSEKNWNNCIGLSLSLLKLTPQHQVAVMEMATNHFGELKRLGEIGQPTIGVITNIGKAHLEFFKNIDGVYRAKMELLENLSLDGTIVIDGEDEKLCSLVKKKFRGEILRFTLLNNFSKGEIPALRDLTGFNATQAEPFNLKNIAAAFTVCKKLGMNEKEMAEKIKYFKNLPMRMEISEIKGVKIINDAYNSNPSSLSYAIEKLAQFKGRKILVAGDMLELGEKSEELHFEMGRLIARAKIDILLTVGKLAEKIGKGARHFTPLENSLTGFTSNSQAVECLLNIIRKGDTILVKGSRGMRMEEIVEKIQEEIH